MLSNLFMKAATNAYNRIGDDEGDKDGCSDDDLMDIVQGFYNESLLLAYDGILDFVLTRFVMIKRFLSLNKLKFIILSGQNPTNVLNVLYSYGNFVLKTGKMKRAKELFTGLQFQAIKVNDFETAGIALNRLGHVSKG